MYKEKIKYIVNNQNVINNFVKSIMNKEVHILPYEEILDVMAILKEESPVMENYIKHECNIAEYADPAWQKEPFFVYETLNEPIILCDRYGCALPIFLTQELYDTTENYKEKTIENNIPISKSINENEEDFNELIDFILDFENTFEDNLINFFDMMGNLNLELEQVKSILYKIYEEYKKNK